MQVILYNQLNPQSIPNFQKMKGFLEVSDFRSADVKKVGHNLYRARLDISNRLLFSLYRSHDHTYILVLVHCPSRVQQIPFLTPWWDDRREQNPHLGSPGSGRS